MLLYVKVPFTTSDLMNWKESAGSYQDNPDKMYRSFRIIIENHNQIGKILRARNQNVAILAAAFARAQAPSRDRGKGEAENQEFRFH